MSKTKNDDLKQFIREVILEKVKQVKLSDEDVKFIPNAPQAPESELLGKYAFSPERRKTGEFGVPEEENTAYEKELHKAIQNHLGGKNMPLSPEHTGNIRKFLNSGFYKKMFRPAQPGTYYRGESASTDRLKKLLGLGPEDKIPGYESEASVNYMWTPLLGEEYGSSWSVEENVAWGFADINAKARSKTPWRIVHITTVSGEPGGVQNNFFSVFPEKGKKHSGLYRIINGMPGEKEIVSLGKIPVVKLKWQINPDKKNQVENEIELDLPRLGVRPKKGW